jgi:hypothetical protein
VDLAGLCRDDLIVATKKLFKNRHSVGSLPPYFAECVVNEVTGHKLETKVYRDKMENKEYKRTVPFYDWTE